MKFTIEPDRSNVGAWGVWSRMGLLALLWSEFPVEKCHKSAKQQFLRKKASRFLLHRTHRRLVMAIISLPSGHDDKARS